MATLKEIAKTANVSIRTVSRALNDSGYVRHETKARILKIARELGFRPHRIARSLRTNRSFEIVVVTESLDELHIAKLSGLEPRLRDENYSVTMLFTVMQQSMGKYEKSLPLKVTRRQLMNEVAYRNPAGVVLMAMTVDEIKQWVAFLTEIELPYIVFDTSLDVDTVRIDRSGGVFKSVCYLAERGRDCIAYLGPVLDEPRLTGYHRAISKLGKKPILLEIEAARTGSLDVRPAVASFLNMKEKPDAIQAYSDEVALKFMGELHKLNITIPDQIAIVGFDNRWASSLGWPQLTTVAQPNVQVGILGAEILLKKVAGATAPPGGWSVTVPTELIVREST